MLENKDILKDLKRLERLELKGTLNDYGLNKLKKARELNNLILCNSSKVVVEEIDSRQQIKDEIIRLTQLL